MPCAVVRVFTRIYILLPKKSNLINISSLIVCIRPGSIY
nr:MAG TPA: hypothetical protein [Caudoviricetes sp.]